jgi:hypothetical protein
MDVEASCFLKGATDCSSCNLTDFAVTPLLTGFYKKNYPFIAHFRNIRTRFTHFLITNKTVAARFDDTPLTSSLNVTPNTLIIALTLRTILKTFYNLKRQYLVYIVNKVYIVYIW